MSVLAPTKAYQQGLDCPLFAPLASQEARPSAGAGTSSQRSKKTPLERGYDGAELSQGNAGSEWAAAAYREASAIINRRGWLIAEDIWEALRSKGIETDHPNAMGAVLARLGRNKIAVNTGLTKATSVSRSHGRPQAIWARPGVMLMQVMNWAGLQ